MNSVTVFAGTEELIATTAGAWAMPATGSMSRNHWVTSLSQTYGHALTFA